MRAVLNLFKVRIGVAIALAAAAGLAVEDGALGLQGSLILERRQIAQDEALAAARKTFDLSVKRFNQGLVSFLDVVDAERTRLDAERAANAIRGERLAIAVALAKAVGGEW